MNYFARCGWIFDVAINVLTGGLTNETVSMRVAEAARDGGPYACLVCRALDFLVQERHCERQFEKGNSPAFVYVRAGIAFAFCISAVAGVSKMIYDGVSKVK